MNGKCSVIQFPNQYVLHADKQFERGTECALTFYKYLLQLLSDRLFFRKEQNEKFYSQVTLQFILNIWKNNYRLTNF